MELIVVSGRLGNTSKHTQASKKLGKNSRRRAHQNIIIIIPSVTTKAMLLKAIKVIVGEQDVSAGVRSWLLGTRWRVN